MPFDLSFLAEFFVPLAAAAVWIFFCWLTLLDGKSKIVRAVTTNPFQKRYWVCWPCVLLYRHFYTWKITEGAKYNDYEHCAICRGHLMTCYRLPVLPEGTEYYKGDIKPQPKLVRKPDENKFGDNKFSGFGRR